MPIDYEQIDDDLDAELMSMYKTDADESESETELDSPDEGTESEENESTQELAASTLDADEEQEDAQESASNMVDKSRYDNAVVAMNKAQQELAERRKQDAERDRRDAERDATIQALQAQLQSLQDQPKEKAASTPTEQLDDEELTEARDLYPEVINPLLKIIDALKSELNMVKNEVGTVKGVADRYQQAEQKSAEQLYWDAIRSRHADVDAIAQSPDYADWYQRQPPLIKQALAQGTADDAIAALNLYRAEHPRSVPDTGPVSTNAKPKADKLAAARQAAAPAIQSSKKPEQKKTFTRAQIDKMPMEEFRKYESAIDEALAKGEIY